MKLPIEDFKAQLIDAIEDNDTLIVLGDTGSGKTTQIPQYIMERWPQWSIVVTQPRRIAAITVARRVAHQVGTDLGDTVGYAVRFEDCSSTSTRLKYVTDGHLVREIQYDGLLSRYNVVVVDEAHERTLDTDILLGWLRRIQAKRPIKVLVMSATLNVTKFADFMGGCPLFTIPGRTFPVDVLHHTTAQFSSIKSSFVMRVVDTVVHVHEEQDWGDVLVFLTGREEIEQACQELRVRCQPRAGVDRVDVWPLYASLETFEQAQLFEGSIEGVRRIIVATNIAQTSVTLAGIKYVVDSGYVKQNVYNPQTGMEALLVVPVSKSAAIQRAGRAGRTQPGACWRIYSRDAYDGLEEETCAEIQRTSLLSTVLLLKQLGVDQVERFEWIDPPDARLVRAAILQLYCIGGLDEAGKLTQVGRDIARFPISPFLARMLLAARELDCLADALTLAALLSISEELWSQPRDPYAQFDADHARDAFRNASGDHMTLINLYHAWRWSGYDREWCRTRYVRPRALASAKRIRMQLVQIVEGLGWHVPPHGKGADHKERPGELYLPTWPRHLLQALAKGFFLHTAKRHANRPVFYHYLASTDTSMMALHLVNESVLDVPTDSHASESEWVIYHQVVFTNKAVMRVVSKLDWTWVEEGLSRSKQVNLSKLYGEAPMKANEATVENKGEDHVDNKRRREEAIDAAKKRYLERKHAYVKSQ